MNRFRISSNERTISKNRQRKTSFSNSQSGRTSNSNRSNSDDIKKLGFDLNTNEEEYAIEIEDKSFSL